MKYLAHNLHIIDAPSKDASRDRFHLPFKRVASFQKKKKRRTLNRRLSTNVRGKNDECLQTLLQVCTLKQQINKLISIILK